MERDKTIRFILMKKMKIKRMGHSKLSFGMKPNKIPREKPQAIAPGSLLEVNCFIVLMIYLNIFLSLSRKFSTGKYKVKNYKNLKKNIKTNIISFYAG